ncbi:MAG: hypothetical protein K6A82_08935 [Prevotella sp.]|nr:hypothetical protein [Prevotella sp.]
MIDKIKDFFRHPLQLSRQDQVENRRIVSKALKSLNCECEWRDEKEDQIVRFDFQNGHFGIRIPKLRPQVELSFLFMAEAEMTDINIVRQVCNQFNLSSDGPRFSYTVNEEKNIVDTHLLVNLLLDEDRVKDILSGAMTDMFGWQNVFVRRLQEAKEEARKSRLTDMERTVKELSREFFLLREQEVSHQTVAPGWRQNESVAATLAQWMDKAFGMDGFVPSELTVITDKVDTLTDRDGIAAYDLSAPLIADGAFVRQKALLDLVFFLPSAPDTRRRITISLQQADGCEDVLYYQVAAILLPLPAAADRPMRVTETLPQSRSALVAYDLRSGKQLHDEFVYMWKEAKGKMANGDEKGLSDEQRLIAGIISQQTARFVYRGKRLYQQKRYLEAVVSLENAFHQLHDGFQQLDSSEREVFFEVCYMLGFCYNDLRQFERSFFYLSFTLGLNRITYAEEYVNCLVNMGDFRSLMCIEGIIAELRHATNDDEGEEAVDPKLRQFLQFLYRRKAYVLVEMRRLDEAETILRPMLNDPDNGDFALTELAYIQQLRDGKK